MSLSARRAWIEIRLADMSTAWNRSLSARRAWIEILSAVVTELLILSLSARRAWIEIASSLDDILAGVVALRKESVDRNLGYNYSFELFKRRSPQGERG